MKNRETLASRLGFIFLSAGCAIGLGNVWRFPYIVGQYGGAAFVLIYLFFLLMLGLPIMVMEFAVGRKSQKSVALAFHQLEPKGSKWHIFSYVAMMGNYLLLMFYSTISGWVLSYLFKMAQGQLQGLNTEQVSATFDALSANPVECVFWVIVVLTMGGLVCRLGLQSGVEKITKWMMGSLLVVMLILVINSLFLPGAKEGILFYLIPDFSKIQEAGLLNVIYAAMGQAFFTLSVGMGGMTIFGSYTNKKHTLLGESMSIIGLDTFVALSAGFIIFPACFSYGVSVESGPGLVFKILPNIFAHLPYGQIWGTLFFVFMSFAALTTIVAVFENVVSFGMDLFKLSRKTSVWVNLGLIIILALPCALGGSVLSFIQPFGAGSVILDLEDFLVSNVIMPLGALVFLLFCTHKKGWSYEAFLEEANTGKGLRFPRKLYFYLTKIVPLMILVIFIMGVVEKFF